MIFSLIYFSAVMQRQGEFREAVLIMVKNRLWNRHTSVLGSRFLAYLSLSFLLCRVQIIVVPILQGCCED